VTFYWPMIVFSIGLLHRGGISESGTLFQFDTATCQVHIPQYEGGSAIDDGPVNEVEGNCSVKNAAYRLFATSDAAELSNFPNPFDHSTSLTFGVERSGNAMLKIYNYNGMEVAVPFDGYAESGNTYRAEYKASGLPEGIYICILQIDGRIAGTRKIILMN
jgi:hypothetical protein